MAVRNFWVCAEIDGHKTDLRGGPRSKDGGMVVTLYQRNEGCIETAVKLDCEAHGDKLFTNIYINGVWCGCYESAR